MKAGVSGAAWSRWGWALVLWAVTIQTAYAQWTDLKADTFEAPSGSYYAGDTLLVGYGVRNNGPLSAPYYTIRVYASRDPLITAADTLISTFDNTAIPAGGSYSGLALVELPAGMATGTWYLGMKLEYVLDSTAGNNTALDATPIAVLPNADLGVLWVGYAVQTIYQGQSRDVVCSVKNYGPGSCPGYTIRFYLSHDEWVSTADRLALSTARGALAHNATDEMNVAVPIPADQPPGTWYIGAIATYDHDPFSPNDTDMGDSAFTVSAAPDLGVLEVHMSADRFAPGESDDVLVTVTNAGGGTAYDYTVSLYLSPDASITTGDTLLAEIERDVSVVPHATDTFSHAATLPVIAGDWYLGVILEQRFDPYPANDTGYRAFTVEHAPIRIVNFARVGPTTVELSWRSFAGDRYRLESCQANPDGTYRPFKQDISATPPTNTHRFAIGAADCCYFRVGQY